MIRKIMSVLSQNNQAAMIVWHFFWPLLGNGKDIDF